jgi:hypothetical protein
MGELLQHPEVVDAEERLVAERGRGGEAIQRFV